MTLPDHLIRDWGRTCLRLIGAGSMSRRASRIAHHGHDCWMLLLLLEGRVQGQDQFGSWCGEAPASLLLPPGHPANEDLAGGREVVVASVLFDALALPGWTNPLTRLPLPVMVPCRRPERLRAQLESLMAPCRRWQVVDPVAAVQARPDLERLLLDHLADGVAAGVYGASVPRSGDARFDLALFSIAKRMKEADLDVAAMANIAGLSPSGFSQACCRRIGLSPRAWLRRERIRLAVRLLEGQPDQLVQEIAWRCGYRSVPLFCRHFRQITGRCARDLRQTGGP